MHCRSFRVALLLLAAALGCGCALSTMGEMKGDADASPDIDRDRDDVEDGVDADHTDADTDRIDIADHDDVADVTDAPDDVPVEDMAADPDLPADTMEEDGPDPLYPPWWEAGYGYRRKVNVFAGPKDIPAGYPVSFTFDHAALVLDEKSLPSGDDVRLLYWNGDHWRELGRVLYNNNIVASSWDADATTIMFKTRSSIPAETIDDNYYLYYGFPEAVDPPTHAPSSRWLMAESLAPLSLDSRDYTNMAQLTFTPGSSDEEWLVLCSWVQQALSGGGDTYHGRGRVTVNGSVRAGNDDITYRMIQGARKSMAVILPISGVTSPQTIAIDFASYSGNSNLIEKARIVAFMVPDPPSSDLHSAETLERVTDSTDPTDSQTLTFTPTDEGDYIWMVSAFMHEGPGGGMAGGLFAEDETGGDRQNTRETYIGSGQGFVPLAHVEKRHLSEGSATFTIRFEPSIPTGSERQGLTQILFRSDVFDEVETASAVEMTSTTSSSYQLKNALITQAVTADHDFVYIAVMGMNHDVGDRDLSTFGEIRLDGEPQVEEEVGLERSSYGRQVFWAFGDRGLGSRAIDSRFKTESGQTVEARFAHILSIRYKEPLSYTGEEELVF